jgi:hypothetical protein
LDLCCAIDLADVAGGSTGGKAYRHAQRSRWHG